MDPSKGLTSQKIQERYIAAYLAFGEWLVMATWNALTYTSPGSECHFTEEAKQLFDTLNHNLLERWCL